MGPRQSQQTRTKQQQFFQNYDVIQQLPNESIRFLQHKQTKKQYLLRQLTYNSKQQYLKAIETIKNKREQLRNNDHVIPLTEYFQKEEDQYCSTFYKLYVMYEYPQRTLDDQINERNLRKNPFTETQLWSILASCILGLSHLQKKGIRHGSLRSSMIFLSQQGLIKISDPFTTGCQTNYDTLLNKRNSRHIYLSPQQTQALLGELICPTNINIYKSDIFTLGMIMLQCGLLQYQDECYRDEYSRIHMETLQYNKNRFRKSYSDQLVNVLNFMLGENAGSRPEWIQLENYVITDSTSKSFISEGRRSNIIGGGQRPGNAGKGANDVQVQSGQVQGVQTPQLGVVTTTNSPVVGIPTRTSFGQKISSEIKPSTTTTINKGIGISTSKQPTSIINYSSPPTNIQTNLSNRYTQVPFVPTTTTEYRQLSSNKPTQIMVESSGGMMKKSVQPNVNVAGYQSYQPTIMAATHSTIQPIPNFTKQFIAQSPVKSQLVSKTMDIQPISVSNISSTRPFRSVFPNPIYTTKTKVDQNLVQVDDDDQTSRSISDISSQYNSQNQFPKNEQFQFSATMNNNTEQKNMISSNGINNNMMVNQSPYQQLQYTSNKNSGNININSNKKNTQSVTNFTPQSNANFPTTSYQPSNQNSPAQQNDFGSRPKFTQGEFVIETFKLGSRYEGYKINGLRHGLGKFFYQDGGMYDGNWVQNKMEGYGKLYYQSGKIAYDGEWIQDQFTGLGVLYNQNPDPLSQPFNYENFDQIEEFWTKYEGTFLQDSKNGPGMLYLSNGEYFEGNFVNDNAQGEGIYTTMSGKKIRGVWENNMLMKQL